MMDESLIYGWRQLSLSHNFSKIGDNCCSGSGNTAFFQILHDHMIYESCDVVGGISLPQVKNNIGRIKN